MHYMGGKGQVAEVFGAFFTDLMRTHGLGRFVEPFCGGLFVTAAMSGERHASDVSQPLITLYQHMQRGWDPPREMDVGTYLRLSAARDGHDPLTAFAGYGCSFGGKFFAGYARRDCNHWGRETSADGRESLKWAINAGDIRRWASRPPPGVKRTALTPGEIATLGLQPPEGRASYYANAARDGLLKRMARCQDVVFRCADYRTTDCRDALVYADPPYAGTTGYADDFDHGAFWEWCRKVSASCLLVVSEYSAPDDFMCVLDVPVRSRLKGNGHSEARAERLFMHKTVARPPRRAAVQMDLLR